VEIGLTKHWRIEPYYARQEDQRASTAHLNRVGVILKLYWSGLDLGLMDRALPV
jgi:hypothetical protein